MTVLKLCGGAAQEDYDFDKCMQIGLSVNDHCVTVGSSLDHCHVPGRSHHDSVPQDAVVLGMGIHNEPGLHEITPIPSAEELVTSMLKYLLDPEDKDRAFVPFKPDDTVALLINNFGGVSNFELEALTRTTQKMLKKDWRISTARTLAQCFETSLNAPGWSISLLNMTGISQETKVPVETLMHLLDKDTAAPSWPKNGFGKANEVEKQVDRATSGTTAATSKSPNVDPGVLESCLRKACNDAIKAEPDVTKWDIQMGDGDCGEAVVGMCDGILKKLDAGLTKDGSLFEILDQVGEAVEEIGGTLGAIIGIILASFTTNLRQAYARDETAFKMDVKTAGQAAGGALNNLMSYTSARVGGRTVMDTLIPFCETLEKEADFSKAVTAAENGAKSTAGMKAKFGRGMPSRSVLS